jgi:uncharacterized protein YecE (DUF72 family)
MTDWWIGTMGFGYQDWRGGFYPQDLSARNYLSYYSRIFNAAEVDSTFYGTPRASTVRRWAALTPTDFQFCLKTPRTITHELGLINAQGLMTEFVQAAQLLNPKLGAILLQFPPSFTAVQLDALAAFLGQLPAGPRYAVELRDASWYAPEIELAALLRAAGVAWASTEYPGLPDRIDLTSSFVYIRWIGQHGSFQHHTHERLDRSRELQGWLERFRAVGDRLETVYGFFNNDYSGFAPATANRFKQMLGLETQPLKPPEQPRLF